MSESTNVIARNTRMMMSSQLVTWVSSFVLMSFLPRYLGAEEYGRLYFAISLNALAGLVMDLGLTMLVVKEVARNREKVNSLFINGGVLRIIAWASSLAITMIFVILSDYPSHTVTIVFILGLANVFLGVYTLIHRLFVGLEQLQYSSFGLILEKVFLAVVGVVALLLGAGATTIAVVMLLSMTVNFLLSFFFLSKLTKINPREYEPSSWPGLLREGFPFMISGVFGFIYYRIDVMMLSSMTNDAVVGWYGAPYRLFDTLMFFPVILNTTVFPVLSRQFQTSPDKVHTTARKLLSLTMIGAMPVAVGMLMVARPIISLLFGLNEYENSVVLLQVLSASLVLVYVNFVLNTVLVSYNKQKQVSWIAPIATVINVTMNLMAIPYFQSNYGNGAIGAAITTAFTEMFALSVNIFLLPKGCFAVADLRAAAKTLGGGLVMAVTIYFMQELYTNWVVAAFIGCAVYAGVLFSMNILSGREVKYLISVLPLRKQTASSTANK